MTDFVPEPRDRLEAKICKFIESKDYKQALKEVEKRLSKGPDYYLQALKCFILCCHPMVTERGKGLKEILDLSKAIERSFTAAELDLYDEAAKALFPKRPSQESAAVCKLRVQAVKAAPKDEKLALACFRACLMVDNLESAQLIAVSLEKNFPSNHAYPFWSITTGALFATSSACPPEKVEILSKLAYQKIKSFASSSIKSPNSTRSLQTPQELLLFHRLVEAQDKDGEILKICRDEALGPASKIARNEWIFRIKELKLMELQEEWPELFDTSYKLLSTSRYNETGTTIDARGADWVVWLAFCRATIELDNAQALFTATKELEAHMDVNSGLDKTYRRNASLAIIEFQFAHFCAELPRNPSSSELDESDEIDLPNPRVLGLWEHLRKYCRTVSAFDDVRYFLEELNFEELQNFAEEIRPFCKWKSLVSEPEIESSSPFPIQESDITKGITHSKLEYFIKSSIAETVRNSVSDHCNGEFFRCEWCGDWCEVVCTTCLQGVAKDSLVSYDWVLQQGSHISETLKPTDKHPADEWAILAAICFMKAAGWKPWDPKIGTRPTWPLGVRELLRAAAVLEYAHSNSKANPQISLLLIRLYSYLGAGSLAMRSYNSLGLKQVQGDTLGYVLLDRISSLHPHAVEDQFNGSTQILDPVAHLKKLQRLYRGFKHQITNNAWKSFEHGSYDSIFQLIEVQDKLSRSIGSAMSAIELRKIDRLTKPGAVSDRNSQGYDLLLPTPAKVNYSDNSDYSAFPNYEHSASLPFEAYTRLAPGPSQERTQAFLLIEELWMLAGSILEPKVKQTTALYRMQGLYETKSLVQCFDAGSEHFTEPESFLVRICTKLITIVEHTTFQGIDDLEKMPIFVGGMCQNATRYIKSLVEILEKVIRDKQEGNWVPMFKSTTHPLYTAYEAASLVIAVVDFLSKTEHWTLFSTDLWKKSSNKHELSLLREAAQILKKLVVDTGATVKKWVNEGQWLDRVLTDIKSENPGLLDDGQWVDGDSVYAKPEQLEPGRHQVMGKIVASVIPEDFLEHWAGELVDSWRESAMGLVCLKPN